MEFYELSSEVQGKVLMYQAQIIAEFPELNHDASLKQALYRYKYDTRKGNLK